jgi:cytochrome c
LRLAIPGLTIFTALLGVSATFAEESAPGALQRDGLALAERMCAQCHAIGKTGTSPHSAAPPFRELDRRVDLDSFTRQLREGLVSGHPDMLTFRFSRDDARALTAYLRYIQE